MKKIFALMLALCMFCTFMPAAFAEGEYFISGEKALFAPPAGKFSAIEYTLTDGTNIAPDAKFEITSKPQGVSLDGNKIVLNGSKVKNGSITLNASSESLGVNATLTVTVKNGRIFTNFEDGVVGNIPSNQGTGDAYFTTIETLDGTTSTTEMFRNGSSYTTAPIAEETNKNKYVQGTRDKSIAIKPDWVGITSSTKIITFDAKMRWNPDVYLGGYCYLLVFGESVDVALQTNGGTSDTTDKELYLVNEKDSMGATLDNAGKQTTGMSNVKLDRTWKDVRVVLNYNNHTYSVYIDDTPIWENYKMASSVPAFLNLIKLRGEFDDIAIYSGEAYEKEVPYTLEGVDNVFLPSTGNASVIPFTLTYKENSGKTGVVEDAKYEISGISGAEVLSDGRIIFNGNTQSGTLSITGYSESDPDAVATKLVKVESSKWFYDFESYSVGAAPALTGSANDTPNPGQFNRGSVSTTHTILGETDEEENVKNKYYGFVGADYSGENTMHNLLKLNNYFKDTATVEFDFLVNTTGWCPLLKIANAPGRITYLTYNQKTLTCNHDATGGNGKSSKMIELGWHNMRLQLNKNTYSIWLDGELWINNYTNYQNNTGFLDGVYFGSPIDNVSIYTGSKYSIETSTGEDVLAIPGAGSSEYALSSVYSDGGAITKQLTYSLDGTYAGVSISGDKLTVASTAEIIPVKVNVTDGFVNGTVTLHTGKDYILVNGEVYEEGADVINAAGTYTVKAFYGSSNMKKNYTMYIAQYEGSKLVKVIPASVDNTQILDLNAELSGSFGATDYVKVFLWDSSLVPVRGEATVQ